MKWKYWTNKKIPVSGDKEEDMSCAMSESGGKKQKLYSVAISRAKWNTASCLKGSSLSSAQSNLDNPDGII